MSHLTDACQLVDTLIVFNRTIQRVDMSLRDASKQLQDVTEQGLKLNLFLVAVQSELEQAQAGLETMFFVLYAMFALVGASLLHQCALLRYLSTRKKDDATFVFV